MRRRRIRLHVVLMGTLGAVLACGAAEVAAQTRMSGPPEGYVEIDGSKDPDAIPLYLVWDLAFRTLAKSAESKAKGVPPPLQFAPADAALVSAEVNAQAARDQACLARQRLRLDELETAHGAFMQTERGPKALATKDLREILIGCRQEVLDASERLRSKMTPEGWFALHRWVLDKRSGIHAFVHEQNLDQFHLPR